MTIPRRTARAHYMPYWFGDSPAAIVKTGRKRGIGYIDQNVNLSKDFVPMMMHWPLLRKNGFRYRQVGNKRVRFNPGNRGVNDYNAGFLVTLRRTARPGRTYASKVGPVTFYTAMDHCKRHGVVMCAELKARAFASPAGLAALTRMNVYCRKRGVTAYMMTLQSMPEWAGKLKNAHRAGFPTAILPRGRKPAAFNTVYSKFINVVWGRWR